MTPGSAPVQISDVFTQVQTDLYESGLKWFSENDIFAAMQEAYNKLVALICPIEKATFFPTIDSPYYDLAKQIPDFLYVAGIYNPATLLWLKGQSYRVMKSLYQTYLCVGNPENYDIMDFRRILIWPYQPTASGALFLVYKAKAPKIYIPAIGDTGIEYKDWAHVPQFPYSVALQLLEYFTVADLLEQSREFSKAKLWWAKIFNAAPGQISIYDQAIKEVKDLARADRMNVLEPYRWIFHGGASGNVTWINNETPAGTIDGTNTTFTLAQVPNPSSSVLLTKNGQILYSTLGYTINGKTVTFASGYIPQPATAGDPLGDSLRAWYQIQ